MPSIARYYRTIRHLTLRQVIYQVWNRLRTRPRLRWTDVPTPAHVPAVPFPITFTYLNQSVTFTDHIDWNYATNGKLWTYHLNYFDRTDSPALIHDFIRQSGTLRDGLEPYPTSLRLLNWRTFLAREGVRDSIIERHLYAQTDLLSSRLEYHLGGNHLLENACALTVMAVYFQHPHWFWRGSALLREQLKEQILGDGGHYERSPVYHQLLTDRLLDVYAVLRADTWAKDAALTGYVRGKTAAMLGWLLAVTFRDGSVPMVNDAACGVAPTTAALLAKATAMGYVPTATKLTDSGYRILTTPRLECFIDVGPVGPDHQPGHAHADTFSFILHIDGKPVVVDPGISTYQMGERRSWERSTAAHNTVTVAGQDSSEVWGGFRVGRRARVRIQTDIPTCVEATHDGYAHLREQHTRRWTIAGGVLRIDDICLTNNLTRKSTLHFDSSLSLSLKHNYLNSNGHEITCLTLDPPVVTQSAYEAAAGFNQTATAPKVTITFSTALTTFITPCRERTSSHLLFLTRSKRGFIP